MARSRETQFLYSSLSSAANLQLSSPLLEIPGELRATIYCFVFCGETIRVRLHESTEHVGVSLRVSTLAVLQTCRLMRAEAVTHLYQNALWKIDDLFSIFSLERVIGIENTMLIRKFHVLKADSFNTPSMEALRQSFGSLKILILDAPMSFTSAAEKKAAGGSLQSCFQRVLDQQIELSNRCWRKARDHPLAVRLFMGRLEWSLPAIDYSLGFKVYLRVMVYGEKVASSPTYSNNIQNANMNKFDTAELESATKVKRYLSYEDESL